MEDPENTHLPLPAVLDDPVWVAFDKDGLPVGWRESLIDLRGLVPSGGTVARRDRIAVTAYFKDHKRKPSWLAAIRKGTDE